MSPALNQFLAQRYGSATAVRALWQWSGGDPATLDFVPEPAEQWKLLWERSDDQTGLLRQALFDYPGAEPPLRALLEQATEEDVLVARALMRTCQSLPAAEYPGLVSKILAPREAALSFAALAPALQRRLSEEQREALEALLAPNQGPAVDSFRDALWATEASQ